MDGASPRHLQIRICKVSEHLLRLQGVCRLDRSCQTFVFRPNSRDQVQAPLEAQQLMRSPDEISLRRAGYSGWRETSYHGQAGGPGGPGRDSRDSREGQEGRDGQEGQEL